MQTVNIPESTTTLAELVDAVARGESFVLAKSGRPVAHLVPITPVILDTSKRFGFMRDQKMVIPDDFDRWAEDEIREMFEGGA